MSELRWNPLDAHWVLMAEERGQRPSDFLPRPVPVVDRDEHPCPFCLIVEGAGPARILAEQHSPNDVAMAVANLFPALRIETPPGRKAIGPWDRAGGVGAHEVIIETRHHACPLRDASLDAAAAVVRLWRDRVADLQRDRRMRWVSVFRNEGAEAGATLEHPHSQVLATPVWPERAARMFENCRNHYESRERCLLCDIVDFERDDGTRIIAEDADFVAFCPYAARHAFEVWIAPITHHALFTRIDDTAARGLAAMLQRILGLLHRALAGAPVNVAVQTAPNPDAFGPVRTVGHESFWHWRLEIVPRTHRYGGFELGAGMVVNPTPPERAAEHLRRLDAR
jgi:UDPglucose--hexose-1-phosphate uridylyltransferase